MKRIFSFPALVLAAGTLTVFSQPQPAAPDAGPASASNTLYQVAERGADYCVWQKVVQITNTRGNACLATNPAYVEVASGLNYFSAAGNQWVEAEEEIEAYPGGAIAQHGQHKVIFVNNLNTVGAIDLEMPDRI